MRKPPVERTPKEIDDLSYRLMLYQYGFGLLLLLFISFGIGFIVLFIASVQRLSTIMRLHALGYRPE